MSFPDPLNFKRQGISSPPMLIGDLLFLEDSTSAAMVLQASGKSILRVVWFPHSNLLLS